MKKLFIVSFALISVSMPVYAQLIPPAVTATITLTKICDTRPKEKSSGEIEHQIYMSFGEDTFYEYSAGPYNLKPGQCLSATEIQKVEGQGSFEVPLDYEGIYHLRDTFSSKEAGGGFSSALLTIGSSENVPYNKWKEFLAGHYPVLEIKEIENKRLGKIYKYSFTNIKDPYQNKSHYLSFDITIKFDQPESRRPQE